MLHIPILRNGKAYESLNKENLTDPRTGKAVAIVSQANTGLILQDLQNSKDVWCKAQKLSIKKVLKICRRAAQLFLSEELPIGNSTQTPEQYVACQSATTGMPETMCKTNMEKIHYVLSAMDYVLFGLTGGIPLDVIEKGYGRHNERMFSFRPESFNLGAVLPSNSPGVHSLWLPALALRVPIVLKPGSRDPWTPMRICQAFLKAGYPPEALSVYFTDYHGGNTIMNNCGRCMIFGDQSTVEKWQGNPRIEVHGPGNSKVLLGADVASKWKENIDIVVDSVTNNGGRSCLNASSVWTHEEGRPLAETLAQRLAYIRAKDLNDKSAQLAAFSDSRMARAVNNAIEEGLSIPGAEDLTDKYRLGDRLAILNGCTFLQPTVIWCDSPDHPLANREFLFPYTSVVEIPESEMTTKMGYSLVVSAITENPDFEKELLRCPNIERLNIGKISTCKVSWEQPHEGNLFEFLYYRRSFQKKVNYDSIRFTR